MRGAEQRPLRLPLPRALIKDTHTSGSCRRRQAAPRSCREPVGFSRGRRSRSPPSLAPSCQGSLYRAAMAAVGPPQARPGGGASPPVDLPQGGASPAAAGPQEENDPFDATKFDLPKYVNSMFPTGELWVAGLHAAASPGRFRRSATCPLSSPSHRRCHLLPCRGLPGGAGPAGEHAATQGGACGCRDPGGGAAAGVERQPSARRPGVRQGHHRGAVCQDPRDPAQGRAERPDGAGGRAEAGHLG